MRKGERKNDRPLWPCHWLASYWSLCIVELRICVLLLRELSKDAAKRRKRATFVNSTHPVTRRLLVPFASRLVTIRDVISFFPSLFVSLFLHHTFTISFSLLLSIRTPPQGCGDEEDSVPFSTFRQLLCLLVALTLSLFLLLTVLCDRLFSCCVYKYI